MKAKKIINIIVDIILIAVVFSVTDIMMIKVFHSENLWLELGIYIVFYGIVFGAKSGIVYLLRKKRFNENAEKDSVWF